MRVLVVEDEPRIAAYLRRGLVELGYSVDAASTGREALDWAETVTFDLIVLDVMLPELDGVSVCRELRRRGSQAAILMLTARHGLDDRVEGLDAGADDYLIKPFDLPELAARLRALARRPTGSPRTSVLELGDLRMDTVRREVTRSGIALRLTAKEYAVLECLLRRPDAVVTRAEIADQIWNYDDAGASNVVDVHIRNLRRKVDAPFVQRLIHTARGFGYRLSTQPDDDTT